MMMLRFFQMSLISTLLLSSLVHADLTSLTSDELAAVDGQAGADLSFEVRFNSDSTGVLDTTSACTTAKLAYCRLALSFNNRFTNLSATTGYKQWLVFKGFHGVINIPKIGFDGADIANTTAVGGVTPAILLSFSANAPIVFNNFGFNALAIETDTVATTLTANGKGLDPTYTAANAGYYARTTCNAGTTPACTTANATANGLYTAAGFDNGRESGFLGMNINASLAVGVGAVPATIKMFVCNTRPCVN